MNTYCVQYMPVNIHGSSCVMDSTCSLCLVPFVLCRGGSTQPRHTLVSPFAFYVVSRGKICLPSPKLPEQLGWVARRVAEVHPKDIRAECSCQAFLDSPEKSKRTPFLKPSRSHWHRLFLVALLHRNAWVTWVSHLPQGRRCKARALGVTTHERGKLLSHTSSHR